MKKKISALVVGVGGMGCPAILSLAQSGVSKICMADEDYVEASNLPRQLWHLPEDLGKPKVDSAYEKLSRQFPKVSFEPLFLRVDEGNAAALFAAHNLLIDATDSAQSKLLFSDIAARHAHVLVSAGVTGWLGQVMRIEPGGPCLRCAFPGGVREGALPSQVGVLGPMAGLLGFWAAALAHAPPASGGEAFMHWVDARRWRTGVLRIEKDGECRCGERHSPGRSAPRGQA
jgi:adenylyltransferase/sulfurtransferase